MYGYLAVFLEIIALKDLWTIRRALAKPLYSETSLGARWIAIRKSELRSAVSLGPAYGY